MPYEIIITTKSVQGKEFKKGDIVFEYAGDKMATYDLHLLVLDGEDPEPHELSMAVVKPKAIKKH